MLGDRSRLLRLVLLGMTVFAAVAWPTKHYRAHAATSGDDDDDGGGGGGGDDDGGGGGDDGGGGGDDDDDSADADQPPVTAGGLFTKATYPIGAIDRPLTLIEGMTEIRLGGSTDLSSGDEFGKFGADIYARYGIQDNLEVRADLLADNNSFTSASVGLEGALNYDPFAVDFRGSLLISSVGGETHVGANIGFPIRYVVKPGQVAVTALESLFTINFNARPDFSPSLGVIVTPVPVVSIVAHATLVDPGFHASKAAIELPVALGFQLTPMNKVDIGLLFRLNQVIHPASTGVDMMGNPIAGSPIDNRELELYLNLRF
jgi:hypothetical protein